MIDSGPGQNRRISATPLSGHRVDERVDRVAPP
jgi:hypothetical protein